MLSAYLYVHEHVVGSLKGNNIGIVDLGSEGRRVGLVVAVSMKCVESSNNHCTFDFSLRRLCQVQDVWTTRMKVQVKNPKAPITSKQTNSYFVATTPFSLPT